jgi:hypothetical protein
LIDSFSFSSFSSVILLLDHLNIGVKAISPPLVEADTYPAERSLPAPGEDLTISIAEQKFRKRVDKEKEMTPKATEPAEKRRKWNVEDDEGLLGYPG